MSEYEYFEFQAIERSLSTDELGALRAISSRATITRTHFSNFYNYGSLKANPYDLLARYFDAFVYLGNFRYRELAFRFPKSSFDAKIVRLYTVPNCLTVETRGGACMLIVSAECPGDETDVEDDDGRGWLSTLAGLRADVAAGDHRLLYLSWLIGVQAGLADDDGVEPPCPPGLGDLPPTLESFIDFAWLDSDLVAAAAEASPPLAATPDGDLEQWIGSLSDTEKTGLLLRVARRDGSVAAELSRRFRRVNDASMPPRPGRRVADLRASAERRAEERRRAEQERAAAADRRRKAQEERARNEYLDALTKRQDSAWREVETLIATRQPNGYSKATALLVDLRDTAERAGSSATFRRRLEALCTIHAGKPAFLRKLRASKL